MPGADLGAVNRDTNLVFQSSDSGPFYVGELTISGHRILHENGCLSGNDVLICMEAICDSRGNNQKKDAFYCVN